MHAHRVCPAQTVPNDRRRESLAALQADAWNTLGIDDVSTFVKHVVWPFCRRGGDLRLVGFHYFEGMFPDAKVDHADLEDAVLPEGYAWSDDDPKHQQNREVCTHGVTLLDREQLIPAECAPLPLPELVASDVVPRLRKTLTDLRLPADLDFLYANRYRKSKNGYIRFHHDQLTKMGPVVVGVSLGAPAHLSLARTRGRRAASDFSIDPRGAVVSEGRGEAGSPRRNAGIVVSRAATTTCRRSSSRRRNWERTTTCRRSSSRRRRPSRERLETGSERRPVFYHLRGAVASTDGTAGARPTPSCPEATAPSRWSSRRGAPTSWRASRATA